MNEQRKNRIDWIIANQNIWDGYPYPGDVKKRLEVFNQIKQMMVGAKLYSPLTNFSDINIGKLIDQARKQMRGVTRKEKVSRENAL